MQSHNNFGNFVDAAADIGWLFIHNPSSIIILFEVTCSLKLFEALLDSLVGTGFPSAYYLRF